METQIKLNVDVFQEDEVREIFAIVQYTYTSEYESSPADEFGSWDATYIKYTASSEKELSLGVVNSISKFNEIKPNLDAIDKYVKEFMNKNNSYVEDFTVTQINIKYRVRENFDITKYTSESIPNDVPEFE